MSSKNKQKQQPPECRLRFSPYAWAKLVFMRDQTDNEVGAFGITRTNDLLFVEDIVIVKQKVSIVTVSFDDLAVADFFENQVDLGRKPEQFARLWLHTHPGSSPAPSLTDEDTFRRVFGSCDWSVMCILAQEGKTFARLHFKAGPSGDIHIPVCVDYSCEFAGSDMKAWQAEYKKNVKQERRSLPMAEPLELLGCDAMLPDDILEQLDQMDSDERQQYMEELEIQSEFWDEEMGVFYE